MGDRSLFNLRNIEKKYMEKIVEETRYLEIKIYFIYFLDEI